MPRFSIRQLLLATAIIAAGCFALLNASAWVASTLFCGVSLVLSAAVLFAIYRTAERRAFWIGFAVLGWVYLFLCFGGIVSTTSLSWHGNATALLAGALYDRTYASQAVPAVPATTVPTIAYWPLPYTQTSSMPNAYTPSPVVPGLGIPTFAAVAVQPSTGPDRESFLYVAHALWTMLIATCGGWLAAWLYATRDKPASRAEPATV